MTERPSPNLPMSCLGCGYDLHQTTSDRCPECGLTFDRDDPATFAVYFRKRTRLMRSPYLRAMLVSQALEEAGIYSRTEEDVSAFAIGQNTIWVDQADLERAIGIMNATSAPGADHEDETQDWTCPACGQLVPASFNICWACGDAGLTEADATRTTAPEPQLEEAGDAMELGSRLGLFIDIPMALLAIIAIVYAMNTPEQPRMGDDRWYTGFLSGPAIFIVGAILGIVVIARRTRAIGKP